MTAKVYDRSMPTLLQKAKAIKRTRKVYPGYDRSPAILQQKLDLVIAYLEHDISGKQFAEALGINHALSSSYIGSILTMSYRAGMLAVKKQGGKKQ